MADKKHLYSSDYETANNLTLDVRVTRLLKPIFDEYSANGYSIRDLCHEILSIVMALEAETILRRNLAEHRKG